MCLTGRGRGVARGSRLRLRKESRPSDERRTAPRSRGHWVKGWGPGRSHSDVLIDREQHAPGLSSWAEHVTSPSNRPYAPGRTETVLLEWSLRARSIHGHNERGGCGQRGRQEWWNGPWESSMGSAGPLRRLVGGFAVSYRACSGGLGQYIWIDAVDLQCVRVLLLS